MTLLGLALSRTCCFDDFLGCVTVGDWQQQICGQAWAEWVRASNGQEPRAIVLVVNYSDWAFLAPGLAAIAYDHQLPPPELVLAELPAIYALSVVDHIEAPMAFLHDAARRLQAGGLLVLTFATWDAIGPDVTKSRATRLRLYNLISWQKLITEARQGGLRVWGLVDWKYRGHVIDGDHSIASLVLIKREERRAKERGT